MEAPIVALAFTPDGAFIAGATAGHILIWKIGDHTVPRASWSRATHPGWLSPKANSEVEEEDEHCLCWDASGHKLAYGANSRVSHDPPEADTVLSPLYPIASILTTTARGHQLPVMPMKACQILK